MNIKEKAKGVGGGILGGLSFLLIILLPIIVLGVLIGFGFSILPFLANATGVMTSIVVFIFLPLLIFNKTREWSASAIIWTSYLFGITFWLYSALIAYDLWGLLGLIIGFAFMGIGVAPIAFLAALFSGEWIILLTIVYMAVLTFGSRTLGIYILEKEDENSRKENWRKVNKNYEKGRECSSCGVIITDQESSFCPECGNKLEI